ncbi:MAG: hypothetical protein ACREKL_09280, partial [Chthoniobacterales bacterium]
GYGRVKQWVDGSGYWERYEYDANAFVNKTVMQSGGAPVGAPADQSDEDIVEHPNPLTRLTIHRHLGKEVARSYVADDGLLLRREESKVPGAPLGDPGSEATVTKFTESTHSEIASVWEPEIREASLREAISICNSMVVGKFRTLGSTWSDSFGVTYHDGAAFEIRETLLGDLTGTQDVRFSERTQPAAAKTKPPTPGREYILFMLADIRGGPQVLKFVEATPELMKETAQALLPPTTPRW